VIYNPDQIKHTLSTILHEREDALAARVLDGVRPEIAFAEHDFGADLFRLDLRIPAIRFVQIEESPSQLNRLKKTIRDKLLKLGIDPEGSALGGVRILPELSVGPDAVSTALGSGSRALRLTSENHS
jgi:hypothetical protein